MSGEDEATKRIAALERRVTDLEEVMRVVTTDLRMLGNEEVRDLFAQDRAGTLTYTQVDSPPAMTRRTK